MSTLSNWQKKLKAAEADHDKALRQVAWWKVRNQDAHGRQMLTAARARLILSRNAVTEAEKVVERHSGVETVSSALVAFVAGKEGFKGCVYDDKTGKLWGRGAGQTMLGTPTQGYGETQDLDYGHTWTRAYALTRLRKRLNTGYLAPVLKLAQSIDLPLSQLQADALASLIYNLGPGILARNHDMGTAIRSKNHQRIADAFLVYDMPGSVWHEGLKARRIQERAMYLKGTK